MKNNSIKKISEERIYRLFELAEQSFKENAEQSDYLAGQAWKISLKNKITLPVELRAMFCRKGKHYLNPEKSLEIKKKLENGLVLAKVCCKKCKYERLTKVKSAE